MNLVDLFAGLGGFSEGARAAGARVVCAANHWRAAVDVHQRNHPDALHLCQDLCQADFTTFPQHDGLLASPACQLPTFERKTADSICQWESGRWNAIRRRGRAANTLRRIGVGRAELGARFLIAYYGNERGGRSIHAPLGTVTTRERFALINGDDMRMMNIEEYRAAMGFPPDYWIPEDKETAVFMLGNAVCPPVATEILKFIKRAA